MARRPVIEQECERCTRTWYTDAKEPEVKTELSLVLTLGTEVIKSEFKCLCDGCQKTVKALVDQIAKVMKKSAPVRGAKKKVEEEAKATSTTQSTTAPSVTNDPAKPAQAPSHAAVAGHAPAGAALRHPTK